MTHFISNLTSSVGHIAQADPLIGLLAGHGKDAFNPRSVAANVNRGIGESTGFPFAQNITNKAIPMAGPIAGSIIGGYFGAGPWGSAAGGAIGGYLTAPEGDITRNTAIGGAAGYLGGTLSGAGAGGGAAGGVDASTAGVGGMDIPAGTAASGAGPGGAAASPWADLNATQAANVAGIAGSGSGGGGGGGMSQYLSSIMGGGGGGGGGGGMSNLQLALGLGSTAYGVYGAQKLQKAGEEAAAKSDPFGPYRAQYGQQLSALEANPSSIESDPAYAASVQAVRRAMAKGGYTMSGNELTALQQNFGQQFQQREQSLAGLAGAGIGPNPGLALQGQVAGTQLMGNSFANLGYMAMLSGMGH